MKKLLALSFGLFLLTTETSFGQNTIPYEAGTGGLTSGNLVKSGSTVGQLQDAGVTLGTLVNGDACTYTSSGAVINCNTSGGAAASITPGTTTVVGATAPCLIENSTSTTMACPAVGTGVIGALANNLSAAGGLTTTIASGTAALGTSSISSAACATVVTVSATNVATTDVLTASFNGDPTAVTGYIPATAGMLTIISYPTSGNVNFKVCNNTSSSVTPGAITLNWRVVR